MERVLGLWSLCLLLAAVGVNSQRLPFNGTYSVKINQNYLSGDQVLGVQCLPQHPQGVQTGPVSYLLLNTEDYFAIDPQSGAVTLQVNALEFPAESTYFATVQCMANFGRQVLRNTTQIEVVYAEENQYTPVFTHAVNIEVVIPESRDASTNAHVVTLNATDQDLGRYGEITYKIQSGDDGLFEVGSTTGVVSLIANLDYETAPSHQLLIYAMNPRGGQGAARISELNLRVSVDPRNDEPPVFEQDMYTIDLQENTQPRNFLQIRCTDADTSSDYIGYVIQSQNVPFAIEYGTGNISAVSELDYEHTSSYTLTFDCVDVNHHSPADYLRDTTRVNVNVIPVNEYRPVLKGSVAVFADIPEDSPAGTLIASGLPNTEAHITFQFSDEDEGLDHGTIRYYLGRSGENERIINDHLNLDELSGNLTLVQPFELNLCRGVSETFLLLLNVIACDITDHLNCPTLRVYIRIIPVECEPEFEHDMFEISISESAKVNQHLATIPCEISQLEDEMITIGIAAVDPDTLQTFSIDQQGLLTLQKPLDFELTQNYTFNIHCVDSRDNEAFTVVEVKVLPENDNHPTFEQALVVVNVTNPIHSTPVTVGYVLAKDDDIEYGSILTYSIERNPYFTIENNGELVLQSLPSNQVGNAFVLNAEASDGNSSASVTILVLLPKTIDCAVGTSEQSDSDTTVGLYAAIGVMAAIVLVCVVMSSCLLCSLCRRSTKGNMDVNGNGNLRIIPMHHEHEVKTNGTLHTSACPAYNSALDSEYAILNDPGREYQQISSISPDHTNEHINDGLAHRHPSSPLPPPSVAAPPPPRTPSPSHGVPPKEYELPVQTTRRRQTAPSIPPPSIPAPAIPAPSVETQQGAPEGGGGQPLTTALGPREYELPRGQSTASKQDNVYSSLITSI